MVNKLLDSMQQQCFVIMPFGEAHTPLYDFVIEPAVRGLGDAPIRTDRLGVPGDVGKQIDHGIRAADYVIVVLDGLRANVLYEFGFARGYGKPTILLNHVHGFGSNSVPFALTMHQRIEYETRDKTLPKRLQEAIRALGLRAAAAASR